MECTWIPLKSAYSGSEIFSKCTKCVLHKFTHRCTIYNNKNGNNRTVEMTHGYRWYCTD